MFSDVDLQLTLSKGKDENIISLSKTDIVAPGLLVSD